MSMRSLCRVMRGDSMVTIGRNCATGSSDQLAATSLARVRTCCCSPALSRLTGGIELPCDWQHQRRLLGH
jgi:hypothetical protein